MEKCPIPAAVMKRRAPSIRPVSGHKMLITKLIIQVMIVEWVRTERNAVELITAAGDQLGQLSSQSKKMSLSSSIISFQRFFSLFRQRTSPWNFFFFVFFFSPEIHSKWTPQCPTWLNTNKSENVAADPHPFFRSASAAPHCLRPADTPPINSVAMKRPLFCRRNFLGKWPVDRPSSATTGHFHRRPHVAILPKTKKNSKNSK